MTNQTAAVSTMDDDVRFRAWQAKGVADDRRTARRMRFVMLFVVAAVAAWSYLQLG